MHHKFLTLLLFCLTLSLLPASADAAPQDAVDWAALLTVPAEEAQREENSAQRMAHNIYSDPDLRDRKSVV